MENVQLAEKALEQGNGILRLAPTNIETLTTAGFTAVKASTVITATSSCQSNWLLAYCAAKYIPFLKANNISADILFSFASNIKVVDTTGAYSSNVQYSTLFFNPAWFVVPNGYSQADVAYGLFNNGLSGTATVASVSQ
jgi:hypothetical protein